MPRVSGYCLQTQRHQKIYAYFISRIRFAGPFAPGVITDPLEKAVCAVMFWAGLHRGELWALKPENLDWKTPKINIDHAWKLFGSNKTRKTGNPKWHKNPGW
jgi:integrase